MLSTIEMFHCIQGNQLGPNSVLCREGPLLYNNNVFFNTRSNKCENKHCLSPPHSLRNFTQGPVNMYNCPVVTVSKSTFENNHAQSVFTDLPSRVSGGGLSITIDGRNNSSVMHGAFNYTIQSCTFFNNNANSTAPTADTNTLLKRGSY